MKENYRNLFRWLPAALVFIALSALPARAQVKFGQQPTSDLSFANPQQYEIGGIQIEGVQYLDQNALISITGLEVGDMITVPGDDLSQAIRKLWSQGLLGDVAARVDRIEGRLIFLTFVLEERPRLSKFTFKGVRKGQAEELRERVNLIRGRIVTDALLSNIRNTITEYYVEKGFLNTEVDIRMEDDTLINNTVLLRILVDRQNKVKINSIDFVGNEVFEDKVLRRKMKETKQRKFIRIFKASKFIRNLYEEDLDKVIAYYNSQGYRDAYIEGDSIYPTPGEEELINIDVRVHEGSKYFFRDIEWTGNYVYNDEQLGQVLGIQRGDVYNLEELEKRLNFNPTGPDVSSLYLDDGYLFFSVQPVEVLVEGDSIDIEMRIYEGAQATIDRVTVSGNTKTSDHVILREIRTLPGQKFSRSNLIRSQREIAQLGYFDPEQIGINPVPNPGAGTVDINYTVVERPSDQIELSGGWGGFTGFVGTLGLTFNNFSIRKAANLKEWRPLPAGDGQRLSLRFQANGRQFQTYSASFVEPWIGGRKPNSFSINLSHTVSNQFRNGFREDPTGGLQVTSFTVGLGRRLLWPDDFFTLNNSITLQRYTLEDFPSQDLGFSTGFANGVLFNTTLARNSIDDPIFPKRGSQFSLSLSLTPPYSLFRESNDFGPRAPEQGMSDEEIAEISGNNSRRYRWIEYHKWMFDGSWFIPLSKKLVISNRAHMGFIGQYNNDLGIGPFERYRVGGDGITGFNFLIGYDIIGLRGYENNSILTGDSDGLLGGVVYNKFVSELRFAISTNPSATIYVHTFMEAGNNWGNYKSFNPFDVYRSAGVGARVFMPAFGLLGVDWGYGFDRNRISGDSRQGQIHFIIGQQIR